MITGRASSSTVGPECVSASRKPKGAGRAERRAEAGRRSRLIGSLLYVVRHLYHFGRSVSDLAQACRLMREGAYDYLHACASVLGVNRRLDAEQAPSLQGRRRARDDPRPRPSPYPFDESRS
jgi:hypothetical protein